MSKFWNRVVSNPKPSSRNKSYKRRSRSRRLRSETLESRQLLAANIFHNAEMPEDVNQDGQVTSLDALVIMNRMNRRGGESAENTRDRGQMTDVNNDGQDSALDALMVLNRVNRDRGRGDNGSDDRGRDKSEDSGEVSDDGNTGTGEVADNDRPDRGDPSDQTDRPDRSDDPESREGRDVVLAWNNLFNEVLVANEENQNPGYASRSMAMLNLAIYDAVSLARGDADNAFYDYESDITSGRPLSAEAAASEAAYTVLSSLYSEQQDMIDQFRDRMLGRFPRNAMTGASVNLGAEVGNAVVQARAGDGSDQLGDYDFYDEAGYFQVDPLNPEVPVWGPSWGNVDPFVISDAESFAPISPPDITSEEYADSYNEVLELGSVDSTSRTAEQTEIGIFWAYDRTGLGTPMALFNDTLESISLSQGNTFEQNVALYAQASVAMADAGIVAWHSKFDEQFWRPVTAIHQGDDDGNPLTAGDTEWTAIGAPDGGDDITGFTPQFPTYVSGHATFGGALFGAIREFYGTDDIAFDLTSQELEILLENPELQEAYGLDLVDAQRSFNSLTEAMAENGRSRVYLGIHFDFDDLVGQEVGQNVATTVSSAFAVPDGERNGDRNRPRPDARDRAIADLGNNLAAADSDDLDLLAGDQA